MRLWTLDKQTEIANILAYGEIHGDAAAAAHFGVSLRSVQRYRKRVKEGTNPELTRAVAEKSKHIASKYGDLMDEVFELSLQALKTRVQTASKNTAPIEDRALIGAIKILGEQRVTRDFLLDGSEDEDEFGVCHDQSSHEAEGAAPEASGSKAKSDPAVH